MHGEIIIGGYIAFAIIAVLSIWYCLRAKEDPAIVGGQNPVCCFGKPHDDEDDGYEEDDQRNANEFNTGFRNGVKKAKELLKSNPTDIALQLIRKEAEGIEGSRREYISMADDDGYFDGLITIRDLYTEA